MSRTIVIRAHARRDINKQADYIGKRNRAAGRRFFDAVQQALQQLATFPELGGLYEFVNPRLDGIRVWSIRGFEKYLIFYFYCVR